MWQDPYQDLGQRTDSDGYGSFMGPSGGRHVSDNIEVGIGCADLFCRALQDCGACPLMYNYSEPWGHVDYSDVNCACLSSDWTTAYVA